MGDILSTVKPRRKKTKRYVAIGVAVVAIGGIAAGVAVAISNKNDGNGAYGGTSGTSSKGGKGGTGGTSPPPPPMVAGDGAGIGSLKLLCLHGGNQNAAEFQTELAALQSALGAQVTFVFGSTPYDADRWWPPQPGGKGVPTTDPDWAVNSFTYLDGLISSQGPFDGIVGYSQGGAMAITYLSQHDALTRPFRFAVILCGYLPTRAEETHTGLVNRINAAAPMSTPALFFIGEEDYVILPAESVAAATKFSSATLVYGPGGHVAPDSGDPLAGVASYVRGFL